MNETGGSTVDRGDGSRGRARLAASLINPVTLKFPDAKTEAAFGAEYQRKSLRQVRVALLLGAFLYAIFGVLDASIIPEAHYAAWAIRYGIVSPLALGLLAFSRSRHFLYLMQPLMAAFIVLAGFGIIAMIALANEAGSALYYAGLMLTCAYGYTFARLRFIFAVPAAWLIVLGYEAVFLVRAGEFTAVALNNTFFLVSINVIGMPACYALEQSARRDFLDKRTIEHQAAKLAGALADAEGARHAAEEARALAERLAHHDSLTELYNRRYFRLACEHLVAQGAGRREPFAVAMIDVDHFKAINDRYGHLVGDMVLQTIAEVIADQVRAADLACRYGGEEFVVVFPSTTESEAAAIGQRLRYEIEQTPFVAGDTPFRVTVSIGVAACVPPCAGPIEEFIDRADAALYVAKRSGRNRLVHASDATYGQTRSVSLHTSGISRSTI